ncbi:MAG: SDR family oxidoreductase [Stellaceae bacterium]
MAVAHGGARDARAARRLDYLHHLGRRHARDDDARHVRRDQGRRLCPLPRPRRRMGPDNVRVNCVAQVSSKPNSPGCCTRTRSAARPLRRLGEPEDIAGVALMLASRAGAFITGQTIIVDGGTTIAP